MDNYFDSNGPLVGREWPITYRANESQRVQTLRRFGARAFTSLIYPHKPNMAAWLNQWAASFAADTPECLHTATFYPEPNAPNYVHDALTGGARVFKAHVQVGDYDPTDPQLRDVWGLIEDAQTPVVIHCGSGPAPGTHTGPEPISHLLREHPRLPLIIAHMGMPEYSDFLDLAERYPHVRLDTTMAFTDFTEATMPFPKEHRSRLAGLANKILHGSDFPNIPYPYQHSVSALIRLNLGDTWTRRVLHDNAAQLFNIDETAL